MKHEERLPECQEKFEKIEDDGMKLFWKIIGIFIMVTLAIIGYLVASDKESRARDMKIEEKHVTDVNDLKEDFSSAILEQTKMNGKIFAAMTRIETLLSAGNINTAGTRLDATERYNETVKRREVQ